jgi:hypothetical protein
MHEVNGRWFWWGAAGPEPFKKLWRMMYDRYTHQHSLTNLIWVFSPGCSTDLADWYPGDDCVDMIGQDHYPMDGNDGAAKDVFDELVALGGGTKMVGMSENGPIPDPDKLVNERADWLFFTTWAGRILTERNPSNKLVKAFYHSHVLNLDDLPDLKNFPFKLAGKASKLAFTSPPGDVAVAGPRRLPVTVSVQDKHGRTVRTGTYTVTLELNRNPSKGELGGTLTASTVNGVATFPDLTLDKAGDGYTLKAKANGLRTGTSAPFRAGPGTGVLGEWWNDSKVEEFPELAQLTAPTRQAVLNKAFEMPVSSVTNYAARFRGFVIPPLTGKYEFWVANAAESELWLSTNSTPAARVKIAEVNPKTPYSKWPHINEAGSTPVRLEAGKRYYIELLQKQKGGSGQLAVRWRLPNGVEERPIPGFRFNPPDADASASQLPRTAN